MDSIIISPKRLQAIIFNAFSRELNIDGLHVEGRVEKEKLTWQVHHLNTSGNHGGPLIPGRIHEIPRSAEFARFKDDDLFLIESYNPDLMLNFFSSEWVRFRDEFRKYNEFNVRYSGNVNIEVKS